MRQSSYDIYTLSLHDALPICLWEFFLAFRHHTIQRCRKLYHGVWNIFDVSFGSNIPAVRTIHQVENVAADRKSTRLNSSHQIISYAVFCLKKKKYTNFH